LASRKVADNKVVNNCQNDLKEIGITRSIKKSTDEVSKFTNYLNILKAVSNN